MNSTLDNENNSLSEISNGDIGRYLILEKISGGSGISVFQAKDIKSGQIVSMKKVMIPLEDGIPNTILREISLLQTLKHPNIVKLLHVFQINQGRKLFFDF